MVNDFDPNSVTDWGNRVISGANGLSSTSDLCSLFDGATIPPVTPTSSPVPTPEGNLAMNQPVQASSSESSELGPEKAVDGDQNTRWGSSYNADNWIYVDLGSSVDINRVIIMWETAYAVRYRLEVSDTANSWTIIYEENSGNGGTDDITVSGTGRYLRMYGVERINTEWGYSIYELAVYGSGGSTTTSVSGGGICGGVPARSVSTIYDQAGMQVQYNGNLYENNWYSQNQNPEENSGPNEVWTLIGPCEGTSPGTLGDVNEDGTIDIIDALLVAQYYVGLSVNLNTNLADVNCDNTVDIIDALRIAQYYVGLIGEFNC